MPKPKKDKAKGQSPSSPKLVEEEPDVSDVPPERAQFPLSLPIEEEAKWTDLDIHLPPMPSFEDTLTDSISIRIPRPSLHDPVTGEPTLRGRYPVFPFRRRNFLNEELTPPPVLDFWPDSDGEDAMDGDRENPGVHTILPKPDPVCGHLKPKFLEPLPVGLSDRVPKCPNCYAILLSGMLGKLEEAREEKESHTTKDSDRILSALISRFERVVQVVVKLKAEQERVNENVKEPSSGRKLFVEYSGVPAYRHGEGERSEEGCHIWEDHMLDSAEVASVKWKC